MMRDAVGCVPYEMRRVFPIGCMERSPLRSAFLIDLIP